MESQRDRYILSVKVDDKPWEDFYLTAELTDTQITYFIDSFQAHYHDYWQQGSKIEFKAERISEIRKNPSEYLRRRMEWNSAEVFYQREDMHEHRDNPIIRPLYNLYCWAQDFADAILSQSSKTAETVSSGHIEQQDAESAKRHKVDSKEHLEPEKLRQRAIPIG